ncbi:MAG: anthranilate phosphoribosyltransferase, partial [Armatimonadetes bacterium]|nr:anthranilate phosphoribosyltransferase [Armatimonadota bacterium]
MQMLVPYLQRLTARDSLSEIESQELFEILMTQDCPPEQVAGVLVALNTKGIAADELVGFVKGLKRHALAFPAISDALVDTCGTGGGTDSFNISTGASIVVAAAGAKVAKHGNRAVSSRCGSADVLEALGVNVNLDAEQAHAVYEKTGMMFLFAPNLHPIMRKVGPIRRALGVRTIFNWLGPLANPAGAKAQLIGVY